MVNGSITCSIGESGTMRSCGAKETRTYSRKLRMAKKQLQLRTKQTDTKNGQYGSP